MKYPEMRVEMREGKSHGLKPPVKIGSKEHQEQLQDTVELCEAQYDEDWSDIVIEKLIKYSPFPTNRGQIISVMFDLGFNTWQEICDFVRDDECIEFMARVSKYCKKYKLKYKKQEKDFLKGQGLGVYIRYLDNLERASQQSFDAKWFFKSKRPLVDIYETSGLDLSCIANYVHPGHFRYPAQHSVKFYKAIDTADNEWELGNYRIKLILGAYIASMGRSGILVHLPEDNLAGGYIADLKEFNNWKE